MNKRLRKVGLGALRGITLADAITRQENAPSYLNNPGALTAASNSYCQLGKQGILVQFCTLADGQAALDNQIQLNVNRGWTLQDFFNSYAPAASGNDPGVYTQNVAGWTGLDPNVPLNSYDPSLLLANAGGGIDILLGGGSGIDWTMVGLGLIAIYAVSRIL